MDENHLACAVRYVSLNPVRAGLVRKARDWEWSSVRAHIARAGDGIVDVRPVLDRFPDFAALLQGGEDEEAVKQLRQSETTGRPLGSEKWLQALERKTGRALLPRKRGPRLKAGK